MTTTLLLIAAVWVIVAVIAALWVGAAMRRADQGERRRLERERAAQDDAAPDSQPEDGRHSA
ncbi:hypothetical protein [Modestobacter italicus]|uniref:hypothetical protein n=1 Tax=Modestobacter italicus (strain DSM 44449 / CECT 9708 / BC 501) TaxID=2732864 RepID=UPI001C963F74|nr:hypothetical protein [Modestobacter italicus]